MKIATRDYYCPTCGGRESHATNHQGEIYCRCRVCGNMPLYCVEIDAHEGLPFVTAVLHAYYFDTTKPEELAAYKALRTKLKGMGYPCFEVLQEPRESCAERTHDGKTVRLFNPETWPDQYVSDVGRLHKWKLAVLPNRRIKAGYWLEFAQEYKA